MESDAEIKFEGIFAKSSGELSLEMIHFRHAQLREPTHDYGMIRPSLGDSCHGNVAVTNRFHL